MYWSDKVAKQIIESGEYMPYHVDDMFTPSGYAHIGSLRGPLVHDLIFKSIKDLGQGVVFTFVINDFDPVDGLPPELESDFSSELGLPLRKARSPQKDFKSFADYFANDYLIVMKKLGVEPEVVSSWDMYREGKFDGVIKEALDNADEIQKIYQEINPNQKKQIGWLPLQIICENCGKLGTTNVTDWNGETVAYACEPNLVKWAQGCGHSGRISPFGGNGKLPWKVDWPAHWKALGVTIEGAGKDHSVAGSSRDVAREICQRVFHIGEPFNLPYEFFTLGGKKMSSSKGLGLKARDIFNILPANVARFLFSRTDYRQEIDFDPIGTMAIPDLFDEYDRCWLNYINGIEEDFSRAFEMAQIDELPPKEKTFLPRFRDVVNFMQQGGDLGKKFAEIKGLELNELEKDILKEREKYGKIWIEKYAPEELKMGMSDKLPEQANNLSQLQKEYLNKVMGILDQAEDAEKLQTELYTLSQEMNVKAKDAFAAIYLSMIGKEYGPKAGQFLLQYPKEKIIQRLQEAIEK